MIANTEAVQVGGAFDRRLWKTGTLKRGTYTILEIVETNGLFQCITLGNTLHKFTDDWLDYIPNSPEIPEPLDELEALRQQVATLSVNSEAARKQIAELEFTLNSIHDVVKDTINDDSRYHEGLVKIWRLERRALKSQP